MNVIYLLPNIEIKCVLFVWYKRTPLLSQTSLFCISFGKFRTQIKPVNKQSIRPRTAASPNIQSVSHITSRHGDNPKKVVPMLGEAAVRGLIDCIFKICTKIDVRLSKVCDIPTSESSHMQPLTSYNFTSSVC